MRKVSAIATTIVCLLASAASAATVEMDAANQDRNGISFDGYKAVRPIIDNSASATALTNVRFKIEIHSGTLGGIGGWAWTNTENPWYGAAAEKRIRGDGAAYTQGIVFYPPTQQWAPYFDVDPTPGAPNSGDEYELFDTVPAGMVWDVAVKLIGWLGGDIEIFSTAEGDLTSTELTTTLYDSDPTPQTIPEPATVVLTLLGAVCLMKRRK